MKNVMKQSLLVLLLHIGAMGSTYGEEAAWSMSIHYEAIEDGIARTIGVTGEIFDVVYMGASLNYIVSSIPIQFAGRKAIAPIYIVMGLKAPWRMAPYIEGGVDLTDSLWDKLESSEEDQETGAEVDYYLAAGLKFDIDKRFAISLYAKEYHFKFKEVLAAPLSKVTPSGYGMAVSMRF